MQGQTTKGPEEQNKYPEKIYMWWFGLGQRFCYSNKWYWSYWISTEPQNESKVNHSLKSESKQVFKQNKEKQFHDSEVGKDFLNRTWKALSRKEKKVNWTSLINIKSVGPKTSLKNKSRSHRLKKYTYYIYLTKDSDSEYRKKFLQINNKKTTQTFKWAKYLNRSFTKENTQVANKHMKRFSTSLSIRDMQNNAIIPSVKKEITSPKRGHLPPGQETKTVSTPPTPEMWPLQQPIWNVLISTGEVTAWERPTLLFLPQ